MACRGFDEQVVRREQQIRELMDQFVCVRLVQANALDLSLFQFDYDLTFAAFFMNADGTIYGRFGSRSNQKDPAKDISMEGFRQALAGALELHKRYPRNKAALNGKKGPTPAFNAPEDYPSLKGKYKPTLDYEGKVARSCIHCHQVREAQRLLYRNDQKPIPAELLYPWPMPDVVGLALDPKEKAKVTSVASGSPADQGGFRAGDSILSLEGQPIISIADVQWVLQQANAPATLKAEVLRGRKKLPLSLRLETDWRRKSDISWRTTTWDLRRMASGGMVLEDLPGPARADARLSSSELALRVKYLGEYGEHAGGKRAGFKKGDVIVSVDGRTERMSESDWMGFVLQNKMPREQVPISVLRAGQRIDLELPLQ